ncbi:MAG: archease [Ignavibacteriales bacterium]|nr:archease [Ignavibacteriales bacterium]
MGIVKSLEHTADIGIEVSADTFEDLFRTSAEALCKISLGNFQTDNNTFFEHYKITRQTIEDLLIEFLSEINFNIATKKKVLVEVADIFIVQVHDGFELMTKLRYIKFNPDIHSIEQEIKAVTYHLLKIEEVDKKYKTKIIFDT